MRTELNANCAYKVEYLCSTPIEHGYNPRVIYCTTLESANSIAKELEQEEARFPGLNINKAIAISRDW